MTFSRAGREKARVTTAMNGSYRVRLAPGTYRIRIARPALGRAKPAEAAVFAGRIRRLNVYVDFGIR